jgi:hypothetical protein
MVTGAHRVDVEVDAYGPESAPPSGAAAAAPPAGALMEKIQFKRYSLEFQISKNALGISTPRERVF